MTKTLYDGFPNDNYIDHQTLLKKAIGGADIYVTQLTYGNYYEYIPISCHAVIDGHVHLSAKYPSASALYHSAHYMVYHYYSDQNSIGLIRTNRIAGDGYNGGMFGLPTCTLTHNWSFIEQKWVIDDCWVPSKSIGIEDIISSAIPVKIRIKMDNGLVIITRPSVVIMHKNISKDTSIRTEPVGILYPDHINVNEYELHLPRLDCRTWVVTPPRQKISFSYILTKFNDIVRKHHWKVNNIKIYSGFDYDILVNRNSNKRMTYEIPSILNKI